MTTSMPYYNKAKQLRYGLNRTKSLLWMDGRLYFLKKGGKYLFYFGEVKIKKKRKHKLTVRIGHHTKKKKTVAFATKTIAKEIIRGLL